MKIETLRVGYLQANCYIVTKNNKALIIDPGDEANKIINFCQDKNIVGILITHHHPDHIGALKEVESHFNIKESIDVDDFNFEVIKTKGHSSDSVTYYFPEENIMFTGDFIFKGTIGRMDFPTGSIEEMKESLDLISTYPHECKIYPGHGDSTTLEREVKRFNLYF